jgi:hypothetical protein
MTQQEINVLLHLTSELERQAIAIENMRREATSSDTERELSGRIEGLELAWDLIEGLLPEPIAGGMGDFIGNVMYAVYHKK